MPASSTSMPAALEALPGVARVFTSRDVPVNEYGLVIKDQPVLCGPGGAKAGADVVRCYMDMVATVVAETDAIAQAALELIDVQYEDLPAVFDPEEGDGGVGATASSRRA